jgi:hypothetical protein
MFLLPAFSCSAVRRRLFSGCCLCVLIGWLTGCSSFSPERIFAAINPDELTPHQQSRLSCSMQAGLHAENDIALASNGTFSLGLRIPTSMDQDISYDRQLDQYHSCLRTAGF